MRIAAAALMLAILPVCAVAQSSHSLVPEDKPQHAALKPAVAYLFPEQITVAAGKATAVDLHFKVAPGLHINSHAPHAEELIPTTLKLPEASGVRLAAATFPPGTDFSFPIDPNEKLSVYTGEFVVHAQLVAERGEHLVEGTLRYQACDDQRCMPPHSIAIAFDVIAK